MATTPTKPISEIDDRLADTGVPSWPVPQSATTEAQGIFYRPSTHEPYPVNADEGWPSRPSVRNALQGHLAFSALHEQVRRRRALASRHSGFETIAAAAEFEQAEQFVLDEVLQLVAERAIVITGADGLGIALAEHNEIVLRASAGAIKPDVGARIQRDSAFSGACFRTAKIIRCDDPEMDERVNLDACRKLGARSMVAVPLCGRRRVIGVLEAFSAEPFGFNDSDVNSLELLAELILGAVKPEDEDRFAESAQVAEAQLVAPPAIPAPATPPVELLPEKIAAPESVLPVEKTPVVVAPVVAATPALALPALRNTPECIPEDAPAAIKPPSSVGEHHPGMVLVLVLLVVSVMVAGGVWWKLKTAQLGNVLIRPEQKMVTKPVAAATHDASAASPSIAPPGPILDGTRNSTSNFGEPTNVGTPVGASNENLTQETPKLTRITGIRHWSSADSSTVVLDLQDQVQYEAHRLANPDRIYFDLHDTSLTTELAGKAIDVEDSLLARVRVAQPASGLTRVVLETKGNSTYSVSLEPNPYRLVMQVRKLGGSSKARENLFPAVQPERQKPAIVVPPPTSEDLQLRTRVPKMRIVVDAGHGGWDLGTVGRRGLLEKDLVLEIAQRLGKLLESRLGAEVILTRNTDNYVPLDERAGMANQSQADLFISVHANYSDLPSARGVETYYTNSFSAPGAREAGSKDTGQRIADAAAAGVKTPTLSATDLHERIEQSRRLAAS